MPDALSILSRRLLALVLVVLLPGLVLLAHAKEAQPASDNPELEARVLAIAQELRCLVCQNETIAASHADLAVDLRQQIRLKLQAGQSKQQIVGFMVDRYGEFVLSALWFHDGNEFPLYQIVWPDRQGRFPWNEGAEIDPRHRQLVLGQGDA